MPIRIPHGWLLTAIGVFGGCAQEVGPLTPGQRLFPIVSGLGEARVAGSLFFDVQTDEPCVATPLSLSTRLPSPTTFRDGVCLPLDASEAVEFERLETESCANFLSETERRAADFVLSVGPAPSVDRLISRGRRQVLRVGPPLTTVAARPAISPTGLVSDFECVEGGAGDLVLELRRVESATSWVEFGRLDAERRTLDSGPVLEGYRLADGRFVPVISEFVRKLCVPVFTLAGEARCFPSTGRLPASAVFFDASCETPRVRLRAPQDGIWLDERFASGPFRLEPAGEPTLFERRGAACVQAEVDPDDGRSTWRFVPVPPERFPPLNVVGERLLSFVPPGEASGVGNVDGGGTFFDQELGSFCEPFGPVCIPSPRIQATSFVEAFEDPECRQPLGTVGRAVFPHPVPFTPGGPPFATIELPLDSPGVYEFREVTQLDRTIYSMDTGECRPLPTPGSSFEGWRPYLIGPVFDGSALATLDRAILTPDGLEPIEILP